MQKADGKNCLLKIDLMFLVFFKNNIHAIVNLLVRYSNNFAPQLQT